MKSKSRLAQLLAMCAEVWDKEISESLANIYWIVLQRFTDEEVETAFSKGVDRWKFFPKPADVVELILGNTDDRMAEAWISLKESCESVGAYRSVIFDDPALCAVVEAWGGWPAVCHMPSDEWKYKYKEFRDFYRAAMARPPESSRRLAGLSEVSNLNLGYAEFVEEPVRIGIGVRRLASAKLKLLDGGKGDGRN